MFFLMIGFFSFAQTQDIKSVDVKNLKEKDINQARQALKDAGLTEQEAIELARQRGATEQQIREFRERLRAPRDTSSVSPFSESEDMEIIPGFTSDELTERKDSFEIKSKVFGAGFFNSRNLTFEPGVNIQTPKSYEIGIGDQIIINIWGNSQNDYQLVVNRDGQIIIPDVGPVYIAGLKIEEAEAKIKQRLTSIYSDMGGSNPQTFAQINLGQLRSIRVNIVGEVTSPGTYTLPVTSSVFNALYLSAGPDSIGSLRNIKVIRDNELFQEVDVYKFLVSGDPSDNVSLKDEDIIFVPPVDIQVKVAGEFRRNGIFEMKSDESVEKLIRFAGGFSGNSFSSHVQIYRKTQKGNMIIDASAEEYANVLLQNGDSVYNGKVTDDFENRVTIDGAVFRPGEYQWKEGLTLYDLIEKAGSLEKDAFQYRGLIARENPDKSTSSISFDVESVMNRQNNIVLQPEDSVLIKSHFDLMEEPYITVAGEVLSPGEYHYSDGLTLSDAVFLADGFTEGADSTFIEVARRLSHEEAAELNDQLVHIFTFQLDRNLTLQPEDASFTLHPFDQVSVRQAPGFRKAGKVTINGEVKYAGSYAISKRGQRISDLLEMSGGVTSHAFVEGATFTRTTALLGHENIAIDLNEIALDPGSRTDLILRDGDVLYIPEYIQTVKVSGSVQNPFSLTYQKGKNLTWYIEKSGGFATDAMKRKVYIRYANGETAATHSFFVKDYPPVEPGSEIIVPAKEQKEAMSTGQWLAIASTFSSIAVAIAAIFR